MNPEAYIALGSNLGEPLNTLKQAAHDIKRLGKVLKASSLYETTPVGGPEGQRNYLNAVISLLPSSKFQSPQKLLQALLAIEKEHGRIRRKRWDARTLDLDLLSYGALSLNEPGLRLPHPRMMERAFVLVPLVEIAPLWKHPLTQKSAEEALSNLALEQSIKKLSYSWVT